MQKLLIHGMLSCKWCTCSHPYLDCVVCVSDYCDEETEDHVDEE